MTESGPDTLMEAVQHFSDPQVCHRYMVKLKWPAIIYLTHHDSAL